MKMKILIVMTMFSVLTITQAYSNGEIFLLVKQKQDGIFMDEFLSDRNYNQTLDLANIVQKKLNYKSQLIERIYTDQLESLTVRFLNVFGDVLFWVTYVQPTVQPGFQIQSQQLSSSHRIDQSGFKIQSSFCYWQYATDITGTWYAIYEGSHLANIPCCPKFLFSGRTTKGNNLAKDAEPDIASQYATIKFTDRVETSTKVWKAAELLPSGAIDAAPLYINTGIYIQTLQIYLHQQQLYYSPWKDCTSFKKLEYSSDRSVVLPVYCLNLTHQRPMPFDLNLEIPVPTGGDFLVAQSMIISGKWVNQDTQATESSSTSGLDHVMTTSNTNPGSSMNLNKKETTELSKMATSDLPLSTITLGLNEETTTTRRESTDKNRNIATSTAYFISSQFERTVQENPSQKLVTLNNNMFIPKQSIEASKLPPSSVSCKSCMCLNITHYLTLKTVDKSLEEIKNNLLLPQKNLSSYIRQKRSAEDKRPSAADMGYVGLAVILGCVSWVVSTDVVHVLYVVKVIIMRKLCKHKINRTMKM